MIASETEYQRTALARTKVTMFGSIALRSLAVEDVLIHKLIAGRYKDEADVDDILRTDPLLDEDYLCKWLDEWGVRERYERIKRRNTFG
ncbi:MAG: hypothetical protein OXI55_02730 [Gammaproteobacteria bacterium]|nr:hypothetical protein [Gammaproteobacteria bacterium]